MGSEQAKTRVTRFLPLLLRSLGTYWSRPASIRGAAPLQYISSHKLKNIPKKLDIELFEGLFAWSEQGLKWRKTVTFSILTFLLLTFALEFTLKLHRSKSCYQITISLTQRCSFFQKPSHIVCSLSKNGTMRVFHINKWIYCSGGSSLSWIFSV